MRSCLLAILLCENPIDYAWTGALPAIELVVPELFILMAFMRLDMLGQKLILEPLSSDGKFLRHLQEFDVKNATCYDPNEELRLKTVIEALGAERFNLRIRELAKEHMRGAKDRGVTASDAIDADEVPVMPKSPKPMAKDGIRGPRHNPTAILEDEEAEALSDQAAAAALLVAVKQRSALCAVNGNGPAVDLLFLAHWTFSLCMPCAGTRSCRRPAPGQNSSTRTPAQPVRDR